jgi:hypothetical protein
MTTTLVLLQLAISLLTRASTDVALTSVAREALVARASQAIQLAAYQASGTTAPGADGSNLSPSYDQLMRASYLTPMGTRVALGPQLRILSGQISFGDLNGDGLDDAVVAIQTKFGLDRARTFLAPMVNMGGGTLFNVSVAEIPDGSEIFLHRIEGGAFTTDIKAPNAERRLYHYKLFGTGFTASQL